MSGNSGRLDWLALTVATLSLAVSAITAYLTLWRSISLEVTAVDEIVVNNQFGATPHVSLPIAFWAAGPKSRKATVSKVMMQIVRVEHADTVNLEASRATGNTELPILLQGEGSQTVMLSFEPRLYPDSLFDLYLGWCASLKNESPAMALPIDSMRYLLDTVTQASAAASVQLDPIAFFVARRPGPRERANDIAKRVLQSVDPRRMHAFVFLVPGRYRIHVRVVDDVERELWARDFTFEIKASDMGILQRDFSKSLSVRLVPSATTQ